MPDGWQWDSTLFRGSAAYYERGLLPYVQDLEQTAGRPLTRGPGDHRGAAPGRSVRVRRQPPQAAKTKLSRSL